MLGYLSIVHLIIAMLIRVAAYVITATSLYSIANRCGVNNAWMAFIPILQFYIIGSICEEYIFMGYRIKSLPWVLCGLIFLGNLGGGFILGAVALAAKIFSLLILHKFFYLFKPSAAMIYTALCIFGVLPLAITLLLIKDTPMQMSAGAYPYPFANKPSNN